MSEDIKVIVRPKVRFSQFSDNEENKKQPDNHKYKNVSQTSGPKIRSIVTLKKPVKIVKPKNFIGVHNKDVLLSNSRKELLTHRSDITSDKIQSGSLSSNNVSKGKTKILHNTNVLQNTKGDCKMSQVDEGVRIQNDTLRSYKKNLSQKGKENKDAVLLKQLESNKNIKGKTKINKNMVKGETEINKNIKRKTENSQYMQSDMRAKLKIPANKNAVQMENTACSKSSKVTKAQSTSNLRKPMRQISKAEIYNAKSALSNVMPCHKYTRNVPKSKVSPVKKTVLRNITGPKIKTYVGSGVSRKKQDLVKKEFITAPDTTAENLAQPEYNSIMCTVNTLKELKQQKVVTDVKRLPSVQKNLISGKISTALDFPLDEIIFKNLVDLSINDKELPCAITRSKDPEPRQKDIVPKLSDFFVPEHPKEICMAVQIKPRPPKIDDNWNPFQISDIIFDWKRNLDDAE